MKAKYCFLIALLVSFGLTSLAQQLVSIEELPPDHSTQKQQSKYKASGDTIWSTTFAWKDETAERGWSLPEGWSIVDNTDFGYPWIWMQDSITIGEVTQKAPAHFASNDDGCINIPVQAYVRIDGAWQANPADTYIMTEPIDCSEASGVIASFNQWWRVCCSGFELLMGVTNDDGVHWAFYNMMYGTRENTFTPPKFKQIEVNISDVAAGMDKVQIMFWFKGAWDYFWMIDDLALIEAFQYDLMLEDTWVEMNGGFDEHVGHINYLPKSQIGMNSPIEGLIGDYAFSGAMINFGMMDAEDVVLNTTIQRNGEIVYNENSDNTLLWMLDRDTLEAPSLFHPADYGDYAISIEAVQENDERPENNSENWNLTVNDTLYLRSDMTAESGANSGGWGNGFNAGDMVGVWYDIYEATEINNITTYISSIDEESNPTMQFVLMKEIPEEGINTEWLVSDIIDVDTTMERTWVTLPLEKDGETEFLEPGRYIACVRSWGDAEGDEDGVPGIWVGWDLTTRSMNSYTYNFQAITGNEFPTGRLQTIGIGLNESGGPTEAPITFNVDMNLHIASGEFTPGTDQVDVAGSFNEWSGSGYMEDADGDGIYSISLAALPIGQEIEFKYRMNANWDTSEFPFGGPNRSYITRYWNDLTHVYNDGETMSVTSLLLDVDSKLYPNPNSGRFQIELNSTVPQDFDLQISNSLGQVVYAKSLPNCSSHIETLDLEVQAGLYFFMIRNSQGEQVRKLIIH